MRKWSLLPGESGTTQERFTEEQIVWILRETNQGIDEAKVTHEIDVGLHQEADTRAEMRWAPHALERTVRRYLHYLQFKRRIEKWFAGKAPTSLVISSGWDQDLIIAATVICKARAIRLEVHDGPFEIYTGLQPFLSAETLPSKRDLSSVFLVRLCDYYARLRNTSILYEPYSNLRSDLSYTDTFRWWKSIATVSYLYKHLRARIWSPKSIENAIDLSVYINPHEPKIINPLIW